MRLDYPDVLPDALNAMLGLERVADSDLDNPRLLDLVKIRASPLNVCSHCGRLHAARGVTRVAFALPTRSGAASSTCGHALERYRLPGLRSFSLRGPRCPLGHRSVDRRPAGSTVVNAMSELSPLHA
jgi:AhpD family alkylhydroperoxidase